jgi:hypothetical protein
MVRPKPDSMSVNVERYLTYLDKEMTIMGILSGFCVATLAASIKVFTSKDASAAQLLWQVCPLPILLAHAMLLFAALAFYRQRSLLAWYYGQIALEDSGYSTGCDLYQWLANADGWDTWINHQRGFWFLAGAFFEGVMAGLGAYIYRNNGDHHDWRTSAANVWGGIALAALFLLAILIQKLILEKWPQEKDPYAEFRNAPFSIFDRGSDSEL